MHHSFQSTSYGVDRKPSPDLACVTRERDGTRPGPIAIGVWLHRLMTIAGQFAAVVVGRAERDGGVEFVSAGHPPVLRLRKDAARQ